jgi:hypothetical protein
MKNMKQKKNSKYIMGDKAKNGRRPRGARGSFNRQDTKDAKKE